MLSLVHAHTNTVSPCPLKRRYFPEIHQNRETRIPQYLAVQIQIWILAEFEFVQRNLSFSIWWISGVQHFQWKLSYLSRSLVFALSLSLTHTHSLIHSLISTLSHTPTPSLPCPLACLLVCLLSCLLTNSPAHAQCVAECCSVLQCVAVCCSVL